MATKARCVLPGTRYLITRRCSEQRLFLLPEPVVTQTFEYLLGLLSQQYAIEVHAYVVMSNHYHLVVTDVEGRLPNFQRDLNSMLARAINHHWGRWESFWDRRSYSAVELVGEDTVIEKMGYTLANPVAAGLVGRAQEWEGATSAGVEFGRTREVARPEGFFRKRMPATATLVLTRPVCREPSLAGRLDELLGQDVARRELEAWRRRGGFLGMAMVLKQDWRSSPRSCEPRGQLRPTVAGRDPGARRAALQRAAAWLGEYKAALTRFVDGERGVEFPRGTWQMCARFGCNCAVG